MLAKINKLTPKQVAIMFLLIGFAVFFTGLSGSFWGDDILQIVNNVPVHSIVNIRLLFEGGTFYNGHGLAPLSGIYFRPLMMTVFSLIYTLFGAHVVAYHIIQLLIYIASAFLLYLVFRYSFKPVLALFLSLIFLVHPINSQVVFAIASLQDVLFFFFGILALWLLLRFSSIRSLVLVALCLFLSMLSKETSIVFIALSLLYLFWFNRERLYKFIAIMVPPIILYLVLKINAVGLFTKPNNAPIDKLSLLSRLYTAPSIMLFYLSKFVFPWRLATSYYWTNPNFSFRHVLLPLIIDLAVVAVVVYVAILIHNRASRSQFLTYLFFAAWAFLGILPYLQIIPLDMTACEIWFYCSMAGFLGMIGVVLKTFPMRVSYNWFLVIGVLLILVLGFRTAARGLDWRNVNTLATQDVSASSDDYASLNALAQEEISQGNYSEAKVNTLKSIAIQPGINNYLNLGAILTYQGNYPGAIAAYENGLKYGSSSMLYENLGAITLLYGNYNTNKQFILNALQLLPQDPKLWMYLAILEDMNNDNTDAKVSVTKAAQYGQIPSFVYDNIINNKTFTLNLGIGGKTLTI